MTPDCVLCGEPTDPQWHCGSGYCPDCCQEKSDDREHPEKEA